MVKPLRHRQTKGAANRYARPTATAPHSYSTPEGASAIDGGSRGARLWRLACERLFQPLTRAPRRRAPARAPRRLSNCCTAFPLCNCQPGHISACGSRSRPQGPDRRPEPWLERGPAQGRRSRPALRWRPAAPRESRLPTGEIRRRRRHSRLRRCGASRSRPAPNGFRVGPEMAGQSRTGRLSVPRRICRRDGKARTWDGKRQARAQAKRTATPQRTCGPPSQ